MNNDYLLTFGGAVKALGNGKVGGYLVQFGSAGNTDLEGDFFTKDTDFDADFPAATTVYYNHALDPTLKGRKLGKGDMTVDDVGVWVESQLELRDDYERAVYALAEKGKLGWSSGTASHLVERKSHKNAAEILRWPLGLDASLTPCPAEPRNAAMTLKSWKSATPVLTIKQYEYDPLENLDESVTLSGLYRLSDAVMSCFYACMESDDPLEERQAQLSTQMDTIRDKALELLGNLEEAEEDEEDDVKTALKRRLATPRHAGVITSERDFERFLRESGFARSAAVTITNHGYKMVAQRDSESLQRDAAARAEQEQRDQFMQALALQLDTGAL